MAVKHPLLYNQQLGRAVQPLEPTAFIPSLTPSEATRAATLENSLKSAGLWSKMINVFPLVGTTKASHVVNIKDASNPLVITGDTSTAHSIFNTYVNSV